jgi:phosphohistidine phosphatase
MRRDLLLLRHAKSAWDDPSLSDHDRPLSPRGATAVRRIHDHFFRAGYRPDVVLCSSARRTVDTLNGIRAALSKRTIIDVSDELYLADAGTLLTRVHSLDEAIRCAVFIGHNPGLEDLAARLVGSGDDRLRAQLAAKFPTGALVALSFEGEWAELSTGAARIDALFVPRTPRV